MYLVKTPPFVQNIFSSLTWSYDSHDSVYLSFDDGPDPACTPWVLDTLLQHDAKATFFCIGQNAERHPDLIKRIRDEGHAIGNHSYSHFSGWSSRTSNYIADVQKCDDILHSKLFRPPYGRLKPSQIRILIKQYKIIMWDVMSGDFDDKLSKEQCLANVTEIANRGSIVLLHDTQQCLEKLKYVLPKSLKLFDYEGLIPRAIPA